MTYDPTRPAPILDGHVRRLRAYLLSVAGHEALAARISEDVGIPNGTLSNRYFVNRAYLAGIERTTAPPMPAGRGRRNRSRIAYRLSETDDA